MGMAFIRFLVRSEEPVFIDHVLDHIDYVARLVGVQHVAIGSDLDVVGNPQSVGGGIDPKAQPNSLGISTLRTLTDPLPLRDSIIRGESSILRRDLSAVDILTRIFG